MGCTAVRSTRTLGGIGVKTPIALVVLVGMLVCGSVRNALGAPPESALEIRNGDKVVTIDQLSEQKTHVIKFWLQKLMIHALYRNVVLESSLSEWQEKMKGDALLYCRYPSTATLAIPERRTLEFDEVLLPMGPPLHLDYIYLKRGEVVLRLAKWDPWVYYKLATESGGRTPETWSQLERHLF